MEVFISDEDKKFINNIEINYNDEHNSIGLIFNNELKSIDQHDAEVKNKIVEELREEALLNPMTYSLYSINKMLLLLHKMGVISDKQLIDIKNNTIKKEEEEELFEMSIKMIISLLKSEEENKND